MPPMRPGALEVEADLRLTVTTADGRSTTAHAVGEGGNLRVTTPRPDVFFAAVDRGDVGPVADALDAVGMSIFVDGPGGQVAVIGSAASSRVGRLLTGSTNAEIQSPTAVPSNVRAVFVAAGVAVVAVVLRALLRGR